MGLKKGKSWGFVKTSVSKLAHGTDFMPRGEQSPHNLVKAVSLHVFINRADMSIMSCTSPLTVHVGFGILAQL